MGLLVRTATGERCVVETEHLIGRSERAALRLEDSFVSSQHASIRWVGDGWELKDLGSRNGTAVDGTPVQAGQVVRLKAGMTVSFGNVAQTWKLVDDSAPRASVVPLDGNAAPMFVDGDVLALPSPDDVQATVIHGVDGSWSLEQQDGTVRLTSGQIFEVGGTKWRFMTPSIVTETSNVVSEELAAKSFRLENVKLEFRVSRDEEHVEIRVDKGTERVDLGSRTHNYM